jgi:hypothetical protein
VGSEWIMEISSATVDWLSRNLKISEALFFLNNVEKTVLPGSLAVARTFKKVLS